MTRVEHTVVINRPINDILEYVSNVGNLTSWAENAVEAEQVSEGVLEVGSTYRIVNKVMGRRLEHTLEVTEYDPAKRYSARSISGPFPMGLTYTVEAMGNSTRLHVLSEADLGGLLGMFGRLLNRKAQKQIESDHAKLKNLLESSPS